MRTRYKIASDVYPYFITSTTVNWIPIFANEKYVHILLEAIRYYQSNSDLEIFAYVIMPEHFHIIAKSNQLSIILRLIKMYSARQIILGLKNECNFALLEKFRISKKRYKVYSQYQIWQEGFKPKEIYNVEMFEQKTNYIHYNPVKRGLVKDIIEWKYSSAGFYETDADSLIEITKYY